MQTNFTLAQLAMSEIEEAESILRKCVHCGFCLATCPTYVLLGDELDSPRGRIYLIKQMLEREAAPAASVVTHIDRCLSCLSCATTCPSGVDYARLIDTARAHIDKTFQRPWADTLLRRLLSLVVPRPWLFRLALYAAWPARSLARFLPGRLAGLAAMTPARIKGPSPINRPQVFPAIGPRRQRVALLTGCAQQVLAPSINQATVRLLTRHGCEVVVVGGVGCCGALVHHMGHENAARNNARANLAAWRAEIERDGLDAIVTTASGCGTMLKDYGHLLADDPQWADTARRIAGLAKDVSELLDGYDLTPDAAIERPVIAYHSACSLQHGQKLHDLPKRVLAAAGFEVRDVPEGHLCCGSAGVYNLLQPELADRLLARKVESIARTGASVVAAGNIGCITQLERAMGLPVVHPVELIDWATGGPRPAALAD